MSLSNPARHAFSRIRLKHLQVVDVIVRHGSVHAAARELNMTQPAISKILRDLEDQLGVALFDRLPRGVQPTSIGLEVVTYARRTLGEAARFFNTVANLKQGGFGSLSIGAVMAAIADGLPDALIALQARHPRMTVHILTGTSDDLMAALERRTIDLAIGRMTEPRHQAILQFEPLRPEPISVFCAPNHPLAGLAEIRPEDLSRQAWVLQAPTSPLRRVLEASLAEIGCAPLSAAIETASIFATVRIVRRSNMLSVLPRNVVEEWIVRGDLVELPVATSNSLPAYGIVTRRNDRLSEQMREFADLVRSHAALRNNDLE